MARPVWDTRRRAAGAVEMVAMEAMAMEGVGGRVGGGGGLGWEAVGSEGREGGGAIVSPGQRKMGHKIDPRALPMRRGTLPASVSRFSALIPVRSIPDRRTLLKKKKNHHARGRFRLTCSRTGRLGPYTRFAGVHAYVYERKWARDVDVASRVARSRGSGPEGS